MFNIETLRSKSESDLAKILKDLSVKVSKNSTDNDKIFAILDFQASNPTVAKEYFASTETPLIKEEKPAIAKKTAVKRPRLKKEEEPQKEEEKKVENNSEKLETPKPETPKKKSPKQKSPQPQKSPEVISQKTQEPKKETTPVTKSESEISNVEEKPGEPHQENPKKKHHQRNDNNGNNGNNPKGNHQNEKTEHTEAKPSYNFDGIISIEGVLEILPDNYGFLRSSDFSYISSPDDVYVSSNQIRNYGLKTGDTVKGIVRLPKEGEKYFSLQKPTEVNGKDLDFIKDRVAFEYLTPLFPQEKFNLAGVGSTISTRIVDLFAPIGKGQRAMIVAQPKTGKTMLLKDIANAISANHPDAYMMVLLIDERPEEVTDMERSVNAEVIASTFDEAAEKHVKVANLVLAKAQRLVECGHDVVILLDSITRLARAYNTVTPASGKILSGGVDANALHKPKRFFGAARKIEGGGSLTIIATALIDTGSKMDEVIFEEFKGTGNMELQLDRKISNKRIYPAIDLVASSTRRDDLLLDEVSLQRMWILRKYLADMNPLEAMEFVEKNIKSTRNNDEFLMSMNK